MLSRLLRTAQSTTKSLGSRKALFSTSVAMASTVNKTAHQFERANLEGLLTKRFFVAPSFEIYSGVSGFYDLGV
jgi:hypothetical protein